jgi:hypothetical protein
MSAKADRRTIGRQPDRRRDFECWEEPCHEQPWKPREDRSERFERREWPQRPLGPSLLDLAIAKRYEFGTIFLLGATLLQRPSHRAVRQLGLRFAKAAMLTQAARQKLLRGLGLWEGGPWRWREEERWCDRCGCPERECRCYDGEERGCEPRCRQCGCPEHDCRCHPHEKPGCEPHEQRCEHRDEPRCGWCGCPEQECRCHHREEPRCQRCGCRESECGCHRRGTADIRIEARAGDVRTKVILVENNSPVDVTIDLEADPWMDASGASVGPIPPMTFQPPQLKLAPREALESTATINVTAPPFTAGMSYFTRIQLKGSKAKPISVELRVEPLNRIDFYSQTDPCRPVRGQIVDFCYDDCSEEPRERGHHHRSEACNPDPLRWDENPWRWTGVDPFRSWYGSRYIRQFWLTPPQGVGCC